MKFFSRILAPKSQPRQVNQVIEQQRTTPLDTPFPEELAQISTAMIEGRRHRIDVPYALPKDEREISRLDFQHYALRAILEGDFAAPVSPSLKTIIDVGAGTGRWGIEMAKCFPLATVIGVDLEDVTSLVNRPSNYRFIEGNIFNGLPFSDASIDFVHQRLLVGAIPAKKWPQVIRELVRVTAPQGWVEILESGNNFNDTGPVTQEILKNWSELSNMLGFDLSLMFYLDAFMESAGLKNVEMRKVAVPLGKWAGRAGEMMARDLQAVFVGFKAAYVTKLGMSPVEFDKLTSQLLHEWDNYHTTYEFYQAYGQK